MSVRSVLRTLLTMTALVLLSLVTLGQESCGEPAVEPTLSSLQEVVFYPTCGQFESCHGGPNPQSDLDMSSAESTYAGLINVDSEEVPGEIRVVPGDADASVFYRLFFSSEGEARQMPIGYELTDEELEAVRIWIDDGAAND